MRVSYTGITSAFQADERGPTPLTRSKNNLSFVGRFFWTNKGVGPDGADLVTNSASRVQRRYEVSTEEDDSPHPLNFVYIIE